LIDLLFERSHRDAYSRSAARWALTISAAIESGITLLFTGSSIFMAGHDE
jgi:hypothetical protein